MPILKAKSYGSEKLNDSKRMLSAYFLDNIDLRFNSSLFTTFFLPISISESKSLSFLLFLVPPFPVYLASLTFN